MALIDFCISLHSGRRLDEMCPMCFVPHLADGGTCSLFSAVKVASDCELKDVHASTVVYHKKGPQVCW